MRQKNSSKIYKKFLIYIIRTTSNRRDGIVVRASASQLVDLVFISKWSHTKRSLKMIFTASLMGDQCKRDGVANKPASLVVVSLAKTLNRMPPSLCGRKVVGPSSLLVMVAQSN